MELSDPAEVVRALFERMEARDWVGARAVVAPDAMFHFSATGETFTGTGVMDMNEAYPEGWQIEVSDVLASGGRVAAQVRVVQEPDVFWCSGFYDVVDGRIVCGIEHWVTEGGEEPPSWRAPFWRPPR